jgi:hypothetical protein
LVGNGSAVRLIQHKWGVIVPNSRGIAMMALSLSAVFTTCSKVGIIQHKWGVIVPNSRGIAMMALSLSAVFTTCSKVGL